MTVCAGLSRLCIGTGDALLWNMQYRDFIDNGVFLDQLSDSAFSSGHCSVEPISISGNCGRPCVFRWDLSRVILTEWYWWSVQKVSYTVVRYGEMNQKRPVFIPVILNEIKRSDSCGVFKSTNGHTTWGQDVYPPLKVAQVNTPPPPSPYFRTRCGIIIRSNSLRDVKLESVRAYNLCLLLHVFDRIYALL